MFSKRKVPIGSLVATLVLASAHSSAGNNGGTGAIEWRLAQERGDLIERRALERPSVPAPWSKGSSLHALLGLLDQHQHKMSTHQLGELRSMLRKLRGSKQRQTPTIPLGEHASVHREAEQTLGRRQALVQAYDPSLGALDKEALAGRTYGVILYEAPGFVVISDPPPAAPQPGKPQSFDVVDPGNINQTRTPGNGMLSGFTIDMLETMAIDLGFKLKYYYPCRKTVYDVTGTCASANEDEALAWLKDGDTDPVQKSVYFGDIEDMCNDIGDPAGTPAIPPGNLRCFVAGAVKNSAKHYQDFYMTQPMWESGFWLVTKEQAAATPLMAFAFPFYWETWLVIFSELLIVGMCFIYVEGYGTNKVLCGPLDLSAYKPGCQLYLMSFVSFLWRLFDGWYWATTICLGAADKAPTTLAGRLLVIIQLFFALIVMTMYTGGVATFLSEEGIQMKVTSFNDYIDQTSWNFDPENSLCIVEEVSLKDFLALQVPLLKANTGLKNFNTVRGDSIDDCLMKVYQDEAVGVVYDHAVFLSKLSSMKQVGMCGKEGGFCTVAGQKRRKGGGAGTAMSSGQVATSEALSEGDCKKSGNTWTKVSGTLIVTGNMLNPFGYGLAFKRNSIWPAVVPSDYLGFSQGIQFLKDSLLVKDLRDKYFPEPDAFACAANVDGAVQLSFQNVSGLFIICVVIMAIGGLCGFVSFFIGVFMKLFGCVARAKEGDGLTVEHEAPVLDAEEAAMQAEIHQKITTLQERLMKVEDTLGVDQQGENGDDEPYTDSAEHEGEKGFFELFAALGFVSSTPRGPASAD